MSLEEVRQLLQSLRGMDRDQQIADWPRHGFFFTWQVSDEVACVGAEAYAMFLGTDNISGGTYPSIRRMRDDLISHTRTLFHGNDASSGVITTGGTESIIVALKCALDRFRKMHPDISNPELICPATAHPACEKAGNLLGFDVVRVPVSDDFVAAETEVAASLSEKTFAIVAAFCNPWHGTCDRIEDISQLALRHDVWLHVDASLGGFIAPYMQELGHSIPAFDFRVAGVSSISADFHKYGYAPKGSSVVIFKDGSNAESANFVYQDDYLSYSTSGIVGTRSGGAIAAAWAVNNLLGRNGYLEASRLVRQSLDEVRRTVSGIPGLTVHGDPQLGVISIGSGTLDMSTVAAHLNARGWFPNLFGEPSFLMLRLVPVHAEVMDVFLTALTDSVNSTRNGEAAPLASSGGYAVDPDLGRHQ